MSREKQFSDDEVWALIEAVRPCFNELVRSFSNSWTAQHKEAAWNRISAKVNAINPQVNRTTQKVMDKWTHLKSQATQAARHHSRELNKTGGGEAPPALKATYAAIVEFLPTETVMGLTGCESGKKDAKSKRKEDKKSNSAVCVVTKKAKLEKMSQSELEAMFVPQQEDTSESSTPTSHSSSSTPSDTADNPSPADTPVTPDTSDTPAPADTPAHTADTPSQIATASTSKPSTSSAGSAGPVFMTPQEYIVVLQEQNNKHLEEIRNELKTLNNNLSIIAQCMVNRMARFFIEFPELMNNNNNVRQRRRFEPRRDEFDRLTDREFQQRLRLNKAAYVDLLQQLEPDISPIIPTNRAVPAATRLQAALSFFASGSLFQPNSDLYGISKASMSRHFLKVVDALVQRVDDYIYMPENLNSVKQGFYDIAGMPNTIGAIDGTHIALTAVSKDIEHVYVNRKGYHSLNIQAMCDADRIFTNVVARWPGSSHDNTIFSSSALYEDLSAGTYADSWVLGDSGYALQNFLLTPFIHQNRSLAQESFNRSHKKTRVVIERAFGELKSRFRCLSKQGGALYFSPEKSCKITMACFCLHNICKRNGLDIQYELDEELDVNRNVDIVGAQQAVNRRDLVVQRFFS